VFSNRENVSPMYRGWPAQVEPFSSPFLLATAIITPLLSCVNTNGENLLSRVVQNWRRTYEMDI
jgi:hypothetical protein